MGMVGASLKLEKESFGLVLRAGRERRKISLAQLSKETNVRPEIWIALEENDLSEWPTGIYARNLIRQYAERVDLSAEELVNEFCRLFPHGDRRRERLMAEYAALVMHRLDYSEPLANTARRRLGDSPVDDVPSPFEVFRKRALPITAAVLDLLIVLCVAKLSAGALGVGFWSMVAAVALTYHAAGVIATGRTAGAVFVDWARTRVVFTLARPAAHGWATSREPASIE
jgi:hypothetical protein